MTPGPVAASPDANPQGDVVVLIPVFNDWDALRPLLADLDATFARGGRVARVLIVDDGSTVPHGDDFPALDFAALRRVEVLTLRRNLGHQRAIAVGLAYTEANVPCRALLLMDGDGEDTPAEAARLLDEFEAQGGRKIIFAERTRRSESRVFKVCYALFRAFHRVLTGYAVRVGNFSVIPRARLESLAVVSEVWNHYPAAVFRSVQPYGTIPTARGRRLAGKSKMNFVRLVTHGLSAISVYSDIIGVRLLLATTGLIVLIVAGLVATVVVRLATPLAIPGWATTAFGLLLVFLSQAVLFSVAFCFMILGGRQGATFLPRRDYHYFVGTVQTLFERS